MKRQLRKDYTDNGYLYIKAYNPYVHGIIGTDIKPTLYQKIRILFSKGISICVGDTFTKDDANGE